MLRTITYRDYTRILEILAIVVAVVVTTLVAGIVAGALLLGLILAVMVTYTMTLGARVSRKLREVGRTQTEPVTRQLPVVGPAGELLNAQVISEEGDQGYRVVLTSSGIQIINTDQETVDRLA
jgi:uncharacterized protein (DUF58 family)